MFRDKPRTLVENPTSVEISWNLKRIEGLSLGVPFDGTREAVVVGVPERGGDAPAEVVVLLQRPTAQVAVFGGAPYDQRQRRVVLEAIDDSDLENDAV